MSVSRLYSSIGTGAPAKAVNAETKKMTPIKSLVQRGIDMMFIPDCFDRGAGTEPAPQDEAELFGVADLGCLSVGRTSLYLTDGTIDSNVTLSAIGSIANR